MDTGANAGLFKTGREIEHVLENKDIRFMEGL